MHAFHVLPIQRNDFYTYFGFILVAKRRMSLLYFSYFERAVVGLLHGRELWEKGGYS